MGKRILTFGDIEIEITKFYRHKAPTFLKDVDVEKVLSNKISFGEKNCKYFIGYLYNDNKVKPLHIMLPKTSVYIKSYDGQTKWMYFLIEDDDLNLKIEDDEKYNTIWDKVSADIKKKINKEPVFFVFKNKKKSHGDEVTDFYDKEIPKVDSNHTFLAVITLDYVLKKDESYYSQVFLKECKYIEKKSN